MKKTKILATVGPACNNVEIMKQMILAGMDAARINFSHGTYESHTVMINLIKEARKALGLPVPMILDTKGPEIRIKTFDAEKIYLEQGAEFTLTTEDIVGNQSIVSVTYQNLPNDLKEGSRVLIDDGLIELKVRSLTATEVRCIVVNSGFLSARKGVNVPDVYVNLPSLTERDIEDIQFGIKMGFDYIAASFIRSANDVLNIRKVLEQNGGEHIKIIAKIESRDGVNNIESILEVADGMMVARGDLGVEIPPEEVPIVQKQLIGRANVVGKPVITATQMLESMVKNPRPTRAEANDVANAIFDGSDVIMLSGETANGNYPVESITMMSRIAHKAESSINYYKEITTHHNVLSKNITNAISFAACSTAGDLNAKCIVPITDSGFAARMVSRSRPAVPILAITTNEVVYRQMNLTWGCIPLLAKDISGNDEVFDIAEEMALKSGLAKPGDTIVALAGVPIGVAGTTNTLKVRTVGNVLAKGEGNMKGTVKGLTRVFKVLEEKVPYFERGDILVSTVTTDDQMEFIKKAGAIVVGSWEQVDVSHAETVAKALDIPLIIADAKVIDLIGDGLAVTLDSDEGFIYNGFR
ncbi:MAG: pyruvate kinase [Clostridiales bacterium]|jgi:pyruvate kinase|nr:pyruvate kinase [Clostridiales bacterium]